MVGQALRSTIPLILPPTTYTQVKRTNYALYTLHSNLNLEGRRESVRFIGLVPNAHAMYVI